MSRSIDLFIDADLRLDQLADQVGTLAGSPMVPSISGDCFVLQHESVRLLLAEHRFVHDRDLPLKHYRYSLSARVDGAARLDTTPEAAVLREVAQKIRQKALWPSLLVLDLQYRDGDGGCTADTDVPDSDMPDSDIPHSGSPNGTSPDGASIDGSSAFVPSDAPAGGSA